MKRKYQLIMLVSICTLFMPNAYNQDTVKINFTNMTPHLGQHLYLSLKNNDTGWELQRKQMVVDTAAFEVAFGGIMPNGSYTIDFWADHNKNGRYDSPPTDHAWRIMLDSVQGDTVVPFVHNTNFTDINWSHAITLAFSNMNPHLGQHLYLALKNSSGWEFERKQMMVDTAAFVVAFDNILPDSSYVIDFFADHNMNGKYDSPPADHAWRIMLDSVKGDTVVPFVHNTQFTDIKWSHSITLAFSNMNPHLGQDLYLAIKNNTGMEIKRMEMEVDTPNFNVVFDSIMPDSSYVIDFWADHNHNEKYDAPPTDHAWRIMLDSVKGDTIVPFVHNTNFTDIQWMDVPVGNNSITIAFSNMTPHIGQNLYFSLKTDSVTEIMRKTVMDTSATFDVVFDSLSTGYAYQIDFFADLNMNGRYDSPPTDHAWRIMVDSIEGDSVIPFVHNTAFTDIKWQNKLTVNFTGMTENVDQVLKLYLRNDMTGEFIDSVWVNPVQMDSFSVYSFLIVPDSSYNVDFYVDFNGNGRYDAPPVDQAWRIPLMNVQGDTVINFAHNTDFTDIELDTNVITGIGDLDADGFSTFPNPVRDELVIKSNRTDGLITGIRIYNSTGSLVLQKTGINENIFRVNVSLLKPGMYILNVGEGQNSKRIKIVKE